MTPTFPDDFRDLLKLFNNLGVEYLLIGGYAVGVYGHVRATNDIDIWIAVTDDNISKVKQALTEFGFSNANDLNIVFGKMTRMGIPPFRVELLTDISGVTFTECYARREVKHLGGLEVPVITLSDLLANKIASGRDKDLLDAKELQNISRRSNE
jgi:predicted nucleotidyltransferase